jgi:hypothetical protein
MSFAATWRAQERRKPKSHNDFLGDLHAALVAQSEGDFARSTTRSVPVAIPSIAAGAASHGHILKLTEDTRVNNGVTRLRQRQCKVCSRLKGEKKRGNTTTYHCPTWSEGKRGIVSLCNVNREHPTNPGLTCGQIYHHVWNNGELPLSNTTSRDRALRKTTP